jgi:hypothetical protein
MRHVLAIPLEQVQKQFETNDRQSLKIVAVARLGTELFAKLRAQGIDAKSEIALEGSSWKHALAGEPNTVCESGEFGALAGTGFTISFGNEHGPQEMHMHRRHAEIYFSEHALEAEYRVEGGESGRLQLPQGGVLVFAAHTWHKVKLGGLTIVIEAPAVEGDKYTT